MDPLTWTAPEFHYYERTSSWYIASIIIALAIMVFALIQRNFLFAIFIVIAELLVLFWAKQEPQVVEYAIDDRGVLLSQDTLRSFTEIQGFAIVTDHPDAPYAELVLRMKRKIATDVKLLIPQEGIGAIKEALKEHLEEIEYEETFAEHLMKILRL